MNEFEEKDFCQDEQNITNEPDETPETETVNTNSFSDEETVETDFFERAPSLETTDSEPFFKETIGYQPSFKEATVKENPLDVAIAKERSVEEITVKEPPFKETIKKKRGFKRYVAIAVVAAIVNLAALAGIFAVGYNLGRRMPNDTSTVLSNLRKEPVKPNKAEETAVTGEELSTVEISKKVGPAVVGITSKSQSSLGMFGSPTESVGVGSGIIISSDGYIVTNNHVIEGALSVYVTLNTGAEYEAMIIGVDAKTDLAVVKITPTEELTVAELGDSSELEVGERAIAIGNPLGMEFFGSTTQGIISAINRTVTVENRTMSLIQTDAAINEGNSGGALVNAYGQVIGINAVKISSSSVEGMGFAIPISEAKPILEDLIQHGYVKGRPVIGISGRDVNEYMATRQGWPVGVQIMGTQPGSGAEIAGLEQGDIITKAGGTPISSIDELNKIKDTYQVGDSIDLEVYRYETGLTETVSVKLSEERPE